MLVWGLATVQVALTFLLVLHMRSFAAAHRRIATAASLDAYKRFVSFQMWGSLALMALIFLVPAAVIVSPLALGDDPGWWPVALLLLPMAFRRQMREAEESCRSLPATAPFEPAYSHVSRIWVDRALPRFDSVLPPSAEAAADTWMVCDRHGRQRSEAACARCGNFKCPTCAGARPSPTSLCEACAVRLAGRRTECLAGERASKTAATLVTTFGIAELCFGSLMLWGGLWPTGPGTVGVPVLVVGLLGFVAGTLWSWRHRFGRRLSLLVAALHLPVLPVGTAIGVFVLFTGIKHAALTSERHRELVRLTSHVNREHVLISLLAGVVVLLPYMGNLLAFVTMARFAGL